VDIIGLRRGIEEFQNQALLMNPALHKYRVDWSDSIFTIIFSGDTPMEKRELLYSGKAKSVYTTDDNT